MTDWLAGDLEALHRGRTLPAFSTQLDDEPVAFGDGHERKILAC